MHSAGMVEASGTASYVGRTTPERLVFDQEVRRLLPLSGVPGRGRTIVCGLKPTTRVGARAAGARG